ncbi:MAG: sigma factor-like helix-turn-helix DNA-binding protein [Oscillospiraceae bacterium]
MLDFYADLLTDKQKEFARLYYNEDLSLAEIAETENITRQGVRDALKRAEHILTSMEQTLGVAKNFMEIREKLADIVRCAQEIKQMDTGSAENASRIIKDAQELLDKY